VSTEQGRPPLGLSISFDATLADDWNRLVRYVISDLADNEGIGSVPREAVLRPDSVAILPYDPSCEVAFLVSQFRLPVYLATGAMASLEVASGRIDQGESLEEAARREASEETGLPIANVIAQGSVFLNPALIAEKTHLFLAPIQSQQAPLASIDHSDMLGDVKLVPLSFDEMRNRIELATIIDAKTIILANALFASSISIPTKAKTL
jgi:NTP pyrophosphohydrolases including oxidative damage repair enzymes